MARSSILLLISGPAGSGKTTLCDRLLADHQPRLQRVITATTRDPRKGERDGVDYHFLEEDDFLRKVQAGEFYEHARVHNRYYGSLKSEIRDKLTRQMDLVLNVDVQGAQTFRENAKDDPELQKMLVTVFVLPISIGQIRERLQGRGKDSPREIERRLVTAEKEMADKVHFDHIIPSGTKEEDYQAFRAIYAAECGA